MDAAVGVVDELASDPLFVLSTSGQELFHSNLLSWLIKAYPDHIEPLWALFGVSVAGPDERVLEVRREWRHLDLYVTTGMTGGKLALENKLHALPSNPQLIEYTAKLGTPAVRSITRCILLSLLPPVARPPEPWRRVPYEDLAPVVRAIAESLDGGFHADLLRNYAALIDKLVRLRDLVDPGSEIDQPMSLDPQLRVRLREARLLSLVEKMRATRLAQLVVAQLEPDAEVDPGLSNTHGLVQHFIPGPAGRYFGWQLQSGQFRLVVITGADDPRKREGREELVEAQHADFFAFDPDGLGSHLHPYTGRLRWLGYEPNFVYKYQPISPRITWRECADLCAAQSRRTEEYVSQLPRPLPSATR